MTEPRETPTPPERERYTHGLLQRLLAGERAAGEELVRAHYEPLRRAVRPCFGRDLRGLLDEEELLQRTFLSALGSLERFEWRGQGAFLAWLKGIALNQLRAELGRRPGRERAAGGGEESAAVDAAPGREATPSQAASSREEEQRIEDALHALGEEDRELVVNRRLLGQDYASLAADLGISEGAVRTRLSRALNRMTVFLERSA
jgi:RNA polymerase sigma-70 factor (ECF subfamily)